MHREVFATFPPDFHLRRRFSQRTPGEMFEEQRPLRLIDQKRQRIHKKREKRATWRYRQAGLRWTGIINGGSELANSMRYGGECPD